MRRLHVGLAAVAIVSLILIGCGGSGESGATETPRSETPVVETPDTGSSPGDAWTTVATLRSSDPTFKGLENLLVSESFVATGEVRLVLDMPGAGATDGVIGMIMSADKATDVSAILDAIPESTNVTLLPSAPPRVASGLEGTYVFVNSVPAGTAWSLQLQTRP